MKTRFALLPATLMLVACAVVVGCAPPPQDFSEATIADLHDQLVRGDTSSVELIEWYLDRIETIDQSGPQLHSVIEVNDHAVAIARSLDDELRNDGPRGPMHGIPVLLKANIDTGDDMATSAGSLALAEHRAPDDAELVANLRASGAVILGKTNLSEWANFRSNHSSSGWSSLGGQTKNPYDTARNPCGSSSGSAVAVAANLAMVAVGTETDGSVVCPSGANGIVGIKPTLGLLSGDGIIPIAHSQDTAGPMARSVRDAAILLGAMAGRDAPDFTANLSADGLLGKRIGVLRSHYGAGRYPWLEDMLERSIETLRDAGAEIVETVEIDTNGMSDAEYEVLLYEFKTDLAKYLEESGAPYKTLEELIEFNEQNRDAVLPLFGQDVFIEAQAKDSLDDPAYLEALATSKRIARQGIDNALAEHDLDAIIAPTNGPAWMTDHVNGDSFHVGSSSLAAVSGYPNLTVPAGFVSGLPVNLSFIGAAGDDKALIEMAYAFEQASTARRAPGL